MILVKMVSVVAFVQDTHLGHVQAVFPIFQHALKGMHKLRARHSVCQLIHDKALTVDDGIFIEIKTITLAITTIKSVCPLV